MGAHAVGRGDLARYPEIAIVLGGGLATDGRPTRSTLLRVDAAAEVAKTRNIGLIVSGSHGAGPKPVRTEAAFMAERLLERGVAPERIFIEDESRDTATNAAYVGQRYLAALTPRRLIIVTSPFHLERSLATFARVLGPAWPLEGHASAPGPNEAEQAKTEARYLAFTLELVQGIEPGDLPGMVQHLRATLPERVSDAPPAAAVGQREC